MGTDLHTNLILNDTRFREGLNRANSSVDKAMGRMTSAFGGFAKALKFGGGVMVVDQIAGSFDNAFDAQIRLATGAQTFRDDWKRNLNEVEQGLMMIPLGLGKLYEDVRFMASDGKTAEMKANASAAFSKLRADMVFELAVLKEKDQYKRQYMVLERDSLANEAKIGTLAGVNNENYRRELAISREIAAIKEKELGIIKMKAQFQEQANRGRSRMNFDDSIEQDDIAMMRARGEDAAADRLAIEAETRRRIRELGNDDTLPSGRNAERTRRLEEIYRIRQEKLDAIKPAAPDYSQSSIGAGGSATLGQIFGPGMSTSSFAKQAASAEKIARESAEQTKLLKSIDAGIRHSGTRYAS